MALRFTVQEVTVDTVKKPGNAKGYQVANVVHTYNGRSQTQKIMSFANPQVFSMVQHLKAGETIDVDITKNDAGYNQWAKVTVVTGEQNTSEAAKPSTGGKVVGSNYETREERAQRQVLIVRQSCLAQAVALYKGTEGDAAASVDDVLGIASLFTDWVFEKPDLFDMPNDLDSGDTAN